MISKQIRNAASALACASMFAIVTLAGCGDDGGPGGTAGAGFGGIGGTGMSASGTGGAAAGTGGTSTGTSGSGGRGGSGGSGGSGGMMPMDAGTACANDGDCGSGESCCDRTCIDTQSDRENCSGCGIDCDDTEMCEDGDCVPAMCSGEPGEPVNPGDEDAGVDDDAGVDGPVIARNGCPPNELCVGDGSDLVCQCGSGDGCAPDEN
jgi:hypothetical protein